MATRKPLTDAEKQYIQTRRQAGIRLCQIARELHCGLETVRKWWRNWRVGHSPRARGRPVAGVLSTYPAELCAQALALKRTHPHWGPANVVVELRHQPAWRDVRMPSLARWSAFFKARCPEAVQPRHRRQYPNQPPPKAQTAHHLWQIDGKEKVIVGEHEKVTVLNVRDPAAALMIASQALLTTTAKGWRKVTLAEVQNTLRAAFTAWGCPLAIQTDHEVVYTGSSANDFPSLFTLWLLGLGITHHTSRDRRPTDQPQVERGHRTLGEMTWADEHFDRVPHLQAALDDCRQRYNTELPVRAADCGGRPPLSAHPEAHHSGRAFHPAAEWQLFDLHRVDAYLAQQVWSRQVSDSGSVSVGHHLYSVGRACAGQTVSVHFLPATRAFRFQAADGTPLRELPAIGFDQADILGFLPLELALPLPFQLPLPLPGV